MRGIQRIEQSMMRRTVFTIGTLAVAISMTAYSHAMMIDGTGAKRPAASEFGLGPRSSAAGRYGGQLATLAEVLDHYNHAPAAVTGHSKLRPLRLKSLELRQLETFLRTLSGPVAISEPAPARRSQ